MNNLKELLVKPVWQMTGEEFLFKQTRFGTGRGATAANHRHGKKVRVRHTRHSQAFRVQPAHSQPHQEKRKDRQSHYPDWTQDYRGCGTGAGTGWQENRRTQIKEVIMDYIKKISPEQAVILWQESRLSLSRCYEKAPEILKVHGSVIGTLGNFSASIGKAKSKENLQCIGYRSRCIEERYRVTICG